MLDRVILEVSEKLDEKIREKYLKDIEEANIEVIKVAINSEYKNPLKDEYSSKGGSLAIEFKTNSCKMPVTQTLSMVNRITHYQAFLIDGVISVTYYQNHKKKMMDGLIKLIKVYYNREE